MPISSLPDECFINVLSYLDKKSLYKCLFVNRYFCKITIPLIWRDPIKWNSTNNSLINTLLACLNEDEISSLIPCAINFNNNQSPLFEYGKFIKKFNHGYFLIHILNLFELSFYDRVQDCRVQKLVNVIYHMIIRQGSNLQEFSIDDMYYIDDMWENIYTDLPKCSTFTVYEPGITNLRSLQISLNNIIHCEYENTIEFLNIVSKSCNGIVDCDLQLSSPFLESFVDIIKSQPLERLSLRSHDACVQEGEKKVMYALEFRSATLKELTFKDLDFQGIDLSFMSKLYRLERLKLIDCRRYLFTKKLHLKELTLLCYGPCDKEYYYSELKITKVKINPLLSEELHMLDIRVLVTPEAVKAVGESCPNLKFLRISIDSESSILPICELSSLKTLNINLQPYEISSGILFKILGDNLKFVECLILNFDIDLPSFKYFTDNCRADLKKLIIYFKNHIEDYLIHVSNYQKVHNSLKLFGIIRDDDDINQIITNEELEIIDLLKNQGVDVEFNQQDLTFNEDLPIIWADLFTLH